MKHSNTHASALERVTTRGVVTPPVAEHDGYRAGKHRRFDVSRIKFVNIEPMPSADDKKPPGAVREYRENAAGEQARLVREHTSVRAAITAQIAADEHHIEHADRTRLAEDSRTMTTKWYRVLLALIFIGEWIIASLVFNVLGTPIWESALGGFVLASLVSASAHFLGKELKREERSLLVLSVALAGALASIVAIAALRWGWMDAIGVVDALGLNMSATTLTLLFGLIQLAAVAVGTLCSHAHARRDPIAEEALIALNQTEERLVRNRDRLANLKQEYRAKCSESNHIYRALAAAWAKGNERARRRGGHYETPIWIEHLEDVPSPPELEDAKGTAPPSSPEPITPTLPEPTTGLTQRALESPGRLRSFRARRASPAA